MIGKAITLAVSSLSTLLRRSLRVFSCFLDWVCGFTGFDTFLEVGPGKTLSGLVHRTLPEAQILRAETWDEVQAAAAEIKNGGAAKEE